MDACDRELWDALVFNAHRLSDAVTQLNPTEHEAGYRLDAASHAGDEPIDGAVTNDPDLPSVG